jgi:hypothetical protein
MLSAASLLLLAAAHGPIDIAYVARFYNPPNDDTRSEYAVYIADVTGKRARRLSTASEDTDIAWVSRDRLAWFNHTTTKAALWIADAPSFRPRLLWSGPAGGFDDEVPDARSRAPVVLGDRAFYVTSHGLSPRRLERPDAVRPHDRVVRSGKVEVERDPVSADGATLTLRRDGKSVAFRWVNHAATCRVNKGAVGDDALAQATYTPNPVLIFPVAYQEATGAPVGYLVLQQGITAHETAGLVLVVDWNARTARWLPGNVCDVSLAAERGLALARSERALRKHGEMQLWMNEAYVGDLKTGTWSKVVSRPGLISSAALRP